MARPETRDEGTGASTDEDLAVRAAGGSRAAFEGLVERYGGSVLSVLERRVGEHHRALDLAQEAWVRVFRALPGFRPDSAFRPWLFSIVLNAARDEARRLGRARVVHLDDFRADAESARTGALDRDENDAVLGALGRVAEPFRTALFLVDVEGLAYEDAALSLGCAVGTVKSRVSRGRLAFREHWKRLSGERIGDATAGGTS
jgi:RNA polymerase sigma-70 factor (ECF subfamily)